jgi:hypothetical protein
VKFWAPTYGFQLPLQISQVAVYDGNNNNVAIGKSCSSSSKYEPNSATCIEAIDGVLSNRNLPSIFHSGKDFGDWMQVDLSESYVITKVVYYNRDSFQYRASGSLLQLINADGVVIAQRTLTGDDVQTFTFSTTETSTAAYTNTCETEFQGGSWLLVRRARQGGVWHPSTDHLLGLDVYGTYGSATSDATFSVAFSSMVTADTEFLFATGNQAKRSSKFMSTVELL